VEIYEQPEVLEKDPWSAGSTTADGSVYFEGLGLDTQRLRQAERFILDGRAEHQLPRPALIRRIPIREPGAYSRRGRIRQRIPLSQSAHGPQHGRAGSHSIGRKRRTPWRPCASPRRKGHLALALCNVLGSTDRPGRLTAACICWPGREIGVASTKAFTAQVAVLTLLALYLGRMRPPFESRGHTDG